MLISPPYPYLILIMVASFLPMESGRVFGSTATKFSSKSSTRSLREPFVMRFDLVRRFGPTPAAEVASPANVVPDLPLGLGQLMAGPSFVRVLVRRLGLPPAAEVASPVSVGPNLPLGLVQLMAGPSCVRALVRRLGPPPAAEVASPASVGPDLPLGLVQLMAGLEVGVRSWASRLLLRPLLRPGALEGQQRAHLRRRPQRRSAGRALVKERPHLGREGRGG